MALLAEAQASDAGKEDAAKRSLAILAEARILADSVGSAELVAAIDKERGLQALRNGRSDLALEPLTTACLHWLGTGNEAPATRALRGLADALEANGTPDVAGRLRDAVREDSLTPARLASIVRTARAEAAADTPSKASRRMEPVWK